ncbi:hypothetical protein CHU98_g12169, partial [Xylaria longipes]
MPNTIRHVNLEMANNGKLSANGTVSNDCNGGPRTDPARATACLKPETSSMAQSYPPGLWSSLAYIDWTYIIEDLLCDSTNTVRAWRHSTTYHTMESGGASPMPSSVATPRTSTPSMLNQNGSPPLVKICVYCGSSAGKNPKHIEAARALGKVMAEKNIELVYGGGTVGLMGEVAKTIVSINGPSAVHGIIPEALVKWERDDTYAAKKDANGYHVPEERVYGRTTVVKDMHTRKRMMAQEVLEGGPGSGFIALSGGFGTMEELLETATWNQLGIHSRGVCVLNIDGFYDGLLDWIRKAVEEQFLKPGNAGIIVTATDAEGAIEALRNYKVSDARCYGSKDIKIDLAPPVKRAQSVGTTRLLKLSVSATPLYFHTYLGSTGVTLVGRAHDVETCCNAVLHQKDKTADLDVLYIPVESRKRKRKDDERGRHTPLNSRFIPNGTQIPIITTHMRDAIGPMKLPRLSADLGRDGEREEARLIRSYEVKDVDEVVVHPGHPRLSSDATRSRKISEVVDEGNMSVGLEGSVNNIVSLLTTVLEADVDVLPIDPTHLDPDKAGFKDAVGKSNVGIMKHIWDLEGQDLAPVLGICLGFQSLVVSCGAVVKRLQTGLHGMIREIDHLSARQDRNIFADVPTFKATLYHSLHADVGQESVPASEWRNAKWGSPPLFPDIVPLAWTYEDRGNMVERILMGVRHRTKPFWGLQYHPESVCTESTGHQVIVNWFQEAMAWNYATGRKPESVSPETNVSEKPKTHMLADVSETNGSSSWLRDDSALSSFGLDAKYFSRSFDIPLHIEVPDVVEILQDGKTEFVVLDSASAKLRRTGLDVRGRYSIIALDVDETLKLEYRTGERHVTARCSSTPQNAQETVEKVELGPSQTIWQFLADFWTKRRISSHGTLDPFIGGFMGYTTYELGLEGIDVQLYEERRHDRADLSFAWVTRSIVIDHLEGNMRIQTLSSSELESQHWLETITEKLTRSPIWSNAIPANFGKVHQSDELTPPHTPTSGHITPKICVPAAPEYESKVRACQDFIAAGDSYELCLTDQTLVTRPRSRFEGSLQPHDKHSSPSSWQLYRSLRTRQPALG